MGWPHMLGEGGGRGRLGVGVRMGVRPSINHDGFTKWPLVAYLSVSVDCAAAAARSVMGHSNNPSNVSRHACG
jgi:hypothetical protein